MYFEEHETNEKHSEKIIYNHHSVSVFDILNDINLSVTPEQEAVDF